MVDYLPLVVLETCLVTLIIETMTYITQKDMAAIIQYLLRLECASTPGFHIPLSSYQLLPFTTLPLTETLS